MRRIIDKLSQASSYIELPSTNILKAILSKNQEVSLLKAAAKDTLETTHLKILKWILGVPKKANNNFC